MMPSDVNHTWQERKGGGGEFPNTYLLFGLLESRPLLLGHLVLLGERRRVVAQVAQSAGVEQLPRHRQRVDPRRREVVAPPARVRQLALQFDERAQPRDDLRPHVRGDEPLALRRERRRRLLRGAAVRLLGLLAGGVHERVQQLADPARREEVGGRDGPLLVGREVIEVLDRRALGRGEEQRAVEDGVDLGESRAAESVVGERRDDAEEGAELNRRELALGHLQRREEREQLLQELIFRLLMPVQCREMLCLTFMYTALSPPFACTAHRSSAGGASGFPDEPASKARSSSSSGRCLIAVMSPPPLPTKVPWLSCSSKSPTNTFSNSPWNFSLRCSLIDKSRAGVDTSKV